MVFLQKGTFKNILGILDEVLRSLSRGLWRSKAHLEFRGFHGSLTGTQIVTRKEQFVHLKLKSIEPQKSRIYLHKHILHT